MEAASCVRMATLVGAALFAACVSPPRVSSPVDHSFRPVELEPLEQAVVDEVNRFRGDPAAYGRELAELQGAYRGLLLRLPGQTPILTREGVAALNEAVSALRVAHPLPRLVASGGMCRAAADHASDIGAAGVRSHTGTDGSDLRERLMRHGEIRSVAAETIYFGQRDATWVLRQLVIGDGVPDRGHRATLLRDDFRRIGVACRPHVLYDTVCVLTFSDGFSD